MFGKFIIRLILTTFFFTSIGPLPDASAQTLIDLPAPGTMVNKSGPYQPLQLKGILVNIKNPLRFDFLVDKGDSGLYGQPLKDEITRSAKYFLTCLTVPENDLWVNLSPYEKDRIVPGNFGITLMGKDLLEQDYLLKQMMASLSYPENDLGKRFWQRVYRKSYELYGTTAIPINTFNKVWIIPKSAQVYAQGNSAFVVNSQLDVMLEVDYKAFIKHLGNNNFVINAQGFSQRTGAYSQVLRDVILPELRQEVNEGKNFAVVRQVYNAMILAAWYKRHLKDSLLGRVYVGRNKVRGIDIADKHAKEKIFQQYLKAYNKCVYNYVKEDYDPFTQQTVPRKYASGGVNFTYLGIPGSTYFGNPGSAYEEVTNTKGMKIGNDLAMAIVDVTATNSDGAMVSFPDMRSEIGNTNPLHVVRMQDTALISQKIGPLAAKMFLSFVVMTAVAVSSPSLKAAQIMPNVDGKTLYAFNRTEILQETNPEWPWDINIAFWGIVIPTGGLRFFKKNGKLEKQSTDDLDKSSSDLSGNTEQSVQKWGFKVLTDEGPALPDAEELDWIQKQANLPPAAVQQINSPVNNGPVKGGLRVRLMDLLSLSMGTGLAASLYSAGDLKAMGIVILVPLMATRLMYAAELWLHEIGHILIALMQSPKNYKKTLTWRNIFGNYGIADWLRTGIIFVKPSQNAGVDVPLTGKARRVNQAAGFLISSAASGGAFLIAAKTALWLPLFDSLGLASLFLIYNSWMTDIWNPSSEGKIECGDSGIIWLPKRQKSRFTGPIEGFFPKFFQAGQKNMRRVASLRGDQGEGIFTWGETRDKDVVPIVGKALKSKRGPSVTQVAQEVFNGKLRRVSRQNIRPLSGDVREIMTHDRFVTQGAPSQEGLHPHLGVTEKRTLCFFKDGEYQKTERTVVSVVIENGDNDAHQKHGTIMPTNKIREFYPVKFHMKKSVFIAPNSENPKGYYDYLPTGDAPPLALQEQWYDNQGDWWAAGRFALDEVFYQSIEESMEYNLSKDEEDTMGDFFMKVYGQGHEQILVRPKLQKRNKTLKDLWVSEEMVKRYPGLAFQYNALERLREDLKRNLLGEALKARGNKNSSAVGLVLNRLQQLHPDEDFEGKLGRFVNMTVKRFFTADILEAAIEIDALTMGTGTYGVRILNSKYPQTGVFWTRGQNISLGENMQAGYMAYNSEHTALMGKFGDVPPVKDILFLNSQGHGQLTETSFDNGTQELVIRAYSPAKRRFLREEELKEWRMELSPDNDYYTPLIERDTDNVTDDDIADIPRAIRDAEKSWDEPGSFVRQSADELFNKLVSRYVERYIKNNSRHYKVAQGNFLNAIDNQARRQCQEGQCPQQEAFARAASLLRAVQNDPRILTYFKSRLDILVAREADEISQEIVHGQMNEDGLFIRLKNIDLRLSRLITREIRALTENVVKNNRGFLRNLGNDQKQFLTPGTEGEGMPPVESIGSGEADLYATGLEDSLWLGSENLKAMLHAFFPEMIIETDSSNKALDLRPNDHHKVGRRTIAFVVSKSGATSPTKNLVPVLNKITPGNIFAMTGRVDTLIGLSLGQRYYKGAPFTRRIFPTGNYYPSEVNSVSEVELMVNQIEMVLYIVKRMKKIFPHQRPWGMDVSDKDIQKLEHWGGNILNKAKHLTGANEDGNRVLGYRENKEILQNAWIFGKMLAETPLINLAHRAFVFCVFYFGAPLATAAFYLEGMSGLPAYSSGLGHFISAFSDTTLALTLPWWISTGFYRIFSGRVQRWARLGPPKVTIGDIPALHQVIENSASKRGSMAISTMAVDYHGGNPKDHFGVRYLHRLFRGAVLIFGLPEDARSRSAVLMTSSQSNVRTDMTIGHKIWDKIFGKRFLAGPEIFTIGHGGVDPNLTQHHMNIGPLETVAIDHDGNRVPMADVTETLNKFYALSFESLDRLIAYNVFFNAAYEWATKWGQWRILRWQIWKGWRVWKPWKSYSTTGVHSTPTPVSGPEKELPDYHDKDHHYSIAGARQASIGGPSESVHADPAQVISRNGGINMDSRLMRLKITGDTQKRGGIYDNDMSMSAIKGVVPKVSGIVTVTPDMLKAMLGTAYLN